MLSKNIFAIGVVILSLLSIGCTKGNPSFSLQSEEEQFVQDSSATNNKLDILFVINDEPSMSSFQDELAASIDSFIQIFATKGFDFKIAVVTTSAYMADPTLNGYDPADSDLADFNDYDGTTYSGYYVLEPDNPDIVGNFNINAHPIKNSAGQDGRAFSSFRYALQEPPPINTGFLRDDSFLAVIIVDNQDDFSGNDRCVGCNVSGRYNASTLDPLSVYTDFLDNLTGTSGATARYNVSAMTQIAAPCQGGTNMVRIMELVDSTNGVLGDICEADFGPSMAEMSNKIATLSTQFFLDRIPEVGSIVVEVDGATVPNDPDNGWTYNSEANSINFHGSAIPQQGAVISVDYDPLSVAS